MIEAAGALGYAAIRRARKEHSAWPSHRAPRLAAVSDEIGRKAKPVAFLRRVVMRLCLDQLKSARRRRETYVGPWLPEPVLTDDRALGPQEAAEQRESVSIAMLSLMLSRPPA